MKAMIFAAGLGTRLRPLTNDRPKALVEVNDITLLEIAIRRLKLFGCKEIIVNVHHFADKIELFLKENDNFEIEINISDERNLLLNTGGGLKKAQWFFEGKAPFLVCNADIMTDLNLKQLYDAHCDSGAVATLATRNRATSRYLIFNEEKELIGWRNVKTGEEKWSRRESIKSTRDRAFSGIHVISPTIFNFMPEETVFSIIDVYLEIAKKEKIEEYPHDDTKWLDVGKLPALEAAKKLLPQIKLGV